MTSPFQYPEFRYIKISKFWKSGQLSVRSLHSESLIRWWWGGVTLCLFIDPYRFSLSLVLQYAVLISNNKWLLIVDEEFLSLSCQHPGNFVPMDHPNHQKFQMDSVIPYLWIIQIQRGHRKDWITNYQETHLVPDQVIVL